MNKWIEILLGLILINGTILLAYVSQGWMGMNISFEFWNATWVFLKGGLVWFLILIGLLFIMLGISDLKN